MSAGLLTETFYETIAPVAQIAPASYAANQLSAAIDMKNIYRLVAIINVGVIQATGTFDAKFVQAVTSGGTYKDVPSKSIVQLTAAADSNPGKPIVIELRADELDVPGGYRFVKLSITPAAAAGIYGATVYAAGHMLPVSPTLWKAIVL